MNQVFASAIIFIAFFQPSHAQLSINNSFSVNDLVTKVLVENNNNLLIDSIVFKGGSESIGSFNYKLEHNSLISKGIIISTGKVSDAMGPNDVPNKGNESYKTTNSGDLDLNLLAQAETYDATVLEFDFVSSTDSISFNFFFASEEYPEYVKKNVNDIFGFFLIDKEQGLKTNIALLPNSETPISIDNVNALKNNDYFIENAIWDMDRLVFFKDKIGLAELAYTLQFDGLTKPIHVGAKVKPNKSYTLKLAIADVGDDIFDSALFLEAESFKSSGNPANTLPKELITNLFDENIVEISDSLVLINYNIAFAFDSDKFEGEKSYAFLNRIYEILMFDKSIKIDIQGYTDNIGTVEYNLELSKKRAINVMNYLMSIGLDSQRVRSVGFGDSKLLSSTDNELNRRVEFLLYK